MSDAAKSLEIVIRTRAELAGAEAAAAALEKQIGAAKAAGKSYTDLEAQLTRARKAIDAFKSSNPDGGGEQWRGFNAELVKLFPTLGKVEALIFKLGTGTIGALIAGLTGLVGLLKVASSGLREFSQAQDVWAKTDAALANVGQLTDANREKFAALASQLQKTTGIADDQWLGVLSRLAMAGATDIDSAAKAVENLAGIMGGDITQASHMVERALLGDYDALKRYGIQVDDSLKPSEKLVSIFDQLKRGAGQLEAQTQTLSGQFRAIRLNISDILEGVGYWISQTGILQAALASMASATEWLAGKLSFLMPVLQGLRNSATNAARAVLENKRAMEEHEKAIARVKDQVDALNESYQRQKSLQEEIAKLNMDELAAQEKLAMARIDAQEELGRQNKPGGLTRVGAAYARAAVVERFQKIRETRQTAQENEQMQNQQDYLDQAGMEEQRLIKLVEAMRDRMDVASQIQATVIELNRNRANGDPTGMLEMRLKSLQSMFPAKQAIPSLNDAQLALKNAEDALNAYQSQTTPNAEKARDEIESIKRNQASRQRVASIDRQTRRVENYSDITQAESEQSKADMEAIKDGRRVQNNLLRDFLIFAQTTDKEILPLLRQLVAEKQATMKEVQMINRRASKRYP